MLTHCCCIPVFHTVLHIVKFRDFSLLSLVAPGSIIVGYLLLSQDCYYVICYFCLICELLSCINVYFTVGELVWSGKPADCEHKGIAKAGW